VTINKQSIDVSFSKGLDTKTDPKRVPTGNFLSLENTIFDKGGLLQKRNGYSALAPLPNTSYTYLTTFRDNLTAIGTNISAYNAGNATWIAKNTIQPMSINTLSVVRNTFNQLSCDSAIAANGVMCTAYIEDAGNFGTRNRYVISDSTTGEIIITPSAIPVSSGTVSGGMRVFVVGTNFYIVFTNTITGVHHLQFVVVSSITAQVITANADVASAYIASTGLSFDGAVVNGKLYIAYNTTAGGQSVKVVYISPTYTVTTATTFLGYTGNLISVCVDNAVPSNPTIYITFYDSSGTTIYTAAVDAVLNALIQPVELVSSVTVDNIASAAQNGTCSVYYEIDNNYSWDSSIPTHYINSVSLSGLVSGFTSVFNLGDSTLTVSGTAGLFNGMKIVDMTTAGNITANTTLTVVDPVTITISNPTTAASASTPGDVLAAVTVSSVSTIIRSVGLASKAFIVDGSIYFLTAYQSTYQPTYFLINGSSRSISPVIAAKIAYQNGGGYLTTGLPNVTLNGTTAQIPYLYKDLIQAVNKDTAVSSGTQTAGIYSQTGINLASFSIGTDGLFTTEIGNDLHLSGGFLWMYDGQYPVEHNFLVYPDTAASMATWSTTGGHMVAQPDALTNTNAYYYQITYEWTDNQGNAFRSAPSIPVAVTTTGSGTTGKVVLNIPTLRLTMKYGFYPAKIVVYRWSVGQQNYYQTTSITIPSTNDTTIDTVQFTDENADATILGNNLIYTTGGVVEDVNAPASNHLTIFDTRLWLVNAEDPNVLWFSKQVLEATPVEMSDLFTMYIPPTTATQGSTGPIKAISVMDDKLIIFKENAILYVNGSGPDNTGANNQYSPAIFITSTVGCTNQKSIVLMPEGLIFQSDKGLWLLDRGLGTSYIGAPVESFTQSTSVTSAVNVPETNQVRFTLDSGITIMYDYYFSQWGTFTGVPAISSCIYNKLHTYINSYGAVYQESQGQYLDGSTPTLIQFQTGPLRLGDLQNYQRAYFFFLLGTYFSPHKLMVSLYYDYSSSPSQSIILSPQNYTPTYGQQGGPYGQGQQYGGVGNLEQFRVFLQQQRCQAVSIAVQEIYDSTLDVPASAGLTLSGINILLGFKGRMPTLPAAISFG
jgi:hypothetical protein